MSKWVKGQSGNPAGSQKTAFREDFDNLKEKKRMFDLGLQITSGKWDEIIQSMANHAIAGNVQAAAFLRDTFIGKPREVLDVDMKAPEGLKITISKDESCL